jgi:ABC-2 type transport system ATP-binding protein
MSAPVATTTDNAVEVHELRKRFQTGIWKKQTVDALRGVSLHVRAGEIFGLLGPNGAGKTTLIKCLLGIVRPTSGTAQLLGYPAGSHAARKRIGYLPENNRIPRHHTANSALEYLGGLSGLSAKQVRARRTELLQQVGLNGWGDTPVRQFSKGMQQRLGLAQAMLHDPQLLVLDEPTDGVDPVGRAELRDVLLRWRAAGKTIFLNSHHLQEMELVCDRVVIMNRGQVVRAGTVAELTAEATIKVTLHDPQQQALTSVPADWQVAVQILSQSETETSLRLPELPRSQWDQLVDRWRAAQISIMEVQRERRTLEESFLDAVQNGQ